MSNENTIAMDSNSLAAGLALLDDIPPLDTAVHRLIEALSDEDISERELAMIIDQCPSLSGKIVGLANSAYFRRNQPINSLHDAIFLIGLRTVKSFAIATALQAPFSNLKCPSFRPGRYWLHDVLTAHAARELSRHVPAKYQIHPEQAYLAGLLHNIGLLALAHLFPDKLNTVLEENDADSSQLMTRTEATFGVNYLTVGAALLKHWRLPQPFVLMARHYADNQYQGDEWVLTAVVGLARDWAGQIVLQQTSATFNPALLARLDISSNHAETVRIKCLDKLSDYMELSEIISGTQAEFYNPETVNHATVELRERLIDTIDSLSSIRELTDLNIRNKSENEILNEALKILMENQDMQRCSIFMNKGNTLINVSGLSWEEHFTGEQKSPDKNRQASTYTFSLGEGIIGIVAETGEIRHAANCAEDPMFKTVNTDAANMPGSLICVPICFQDTTLGVLNISHSQPNVFSEWHERFLLVYAKMLGQLIVYNRLIHDMDSEINQRTKELQVALARAETLSTRDELTGIHNRRYFISHFNKLIEQSDRYGYKLSVLMIDIDDFKHINDTYGHLEGDRTLIKVAQTLNACARDADIVSRMGGEEFMVALLHADCEKSMHVANRILKRISELECGERENYHITASIGISCHGKSEKVTRKPTEQWIQQADNALYNAKRSGKNCVSLYKSKT